MARKTIGIVGGLAPVSTVSYYERIVERYRAVAGDERYPEIVVLSLPFQEMVEREYRWPGRMLEALERLAAAGADFAVAACNSIHVVYDDVAPRSPIPWVHIADAVAAEIRTRRVSRVLLMGTMFTMEADFYPKRLAAAGIGTAVPGPEARAEIHGVIYGELVKGVVRDESRRRLLRHTLVPPGSECGGVVLGCTELPLLIRPEDSPLQIFDTAAIHADYALDAALGIRPVPGL